MVANTFPASSSGSSIHPSAVLRSLQRGDQEHGLGKLLELYRNYLRLMADSQLDKKLRARFSPSDLVQETMLEAHRDFHQFRGASEGEFLSWLRRILVHNLARAIEAHVLAGKRDVRREVSLDHMRTSLERSTARLAAVLPGRECSPSDEAERRESAVMLADVMSQLSGDHREVLMLRNLQGLAFQEVAQRMDRSVPAAKMLWVRAIKQMRDRMQDRSSA